MIDLDQLDNAFFRLDAERSVDSALNAAVGEYLRLMECAATLAEADHPTSAGEAMVFLRAAQKLANEHGLPVKSLFDGIHALIVENPNREAPSSKLAARTLRDPATYPIHCPSTSPFDAAIVEIARQLAASRNYGKEPASEAVRSQAEKDTRAAIVALLGS